MTQKDEILETPKSLEKLHQYEFSQINFGRNVAIAAGHAIKITLEIPAENGQYGLPAKLDSFIINENE